MVHWGRRLCFKVGDLGESVNNLYLSQECLFARDKNNSFDSSGECAYYNKDKTLALLMILTRKKTKY